MKKSKAKKSHTLKHLFIPHHKNNYRPHAFRHKMLTLYSFLLLSSQVMMGMTYMSGTSLVSENVDVMKKNIIILTNEERRESGIVTLNENSLLNQAAKAKMEDMLQKNYWDHVSPDNKQAWDFISAADYRYSFAGENLAKGFIDSKSAVTAWMNSASHKKNILNNNYTDIGVSVGQGKIDGKPTILIVQIFGTPQPMVAGSENAQISNENVSTGDKKTSPTLSQSNVTITQRLPFFVFWVLLFVLIIFDGLALRKLGLHKSKKHMFQFRSALLINFFVLVILGLNYVSIA